MTPACIVLAEDDSALREFLKLSLQRAGYIVHDFGDGLSALDYFKHGQNADLLLADIVMPGIDGIELSQKVTAIAPAIKIMYITGFATVAKDRLNDTPHGAQVLAKPVHLGLLIEQVDKLLRPAVI